MCEGIIPAYPNETLKDDFERCIVRSDGEPIQKFNKEFFVQITLDNPGEKNFKYVPVEDSFAEDRFGNKMGIGDLVLSPQGSDNGGSWVDPIIVKSIQKDRIIPDVKDRSYYLADRCILLRSVHGVEPKYGDKDFLQGKD